MSQTKTDLTYLKIKTNTNNLNVMYTYNLPNIIIWFKMDSIESSFFFMK